MCNLHAKVLQKGTFHDESAISTSPKQHRSSVAHENTDQSSLKGELRNMFRRRCGVLNTVLTFCLGGQSCDQQPEMCQNSEIVSGIHVCANGGVKIQTQNGQKETAEENIEAESKEPAVT